MKRVAVVALALLLGLFFVGGVYAQSEGRGATDIFQQEFGQTKTLMFEGTVLSHDVTCHCFVLKTGKGNMTFQDDYAKFDNDYDRAKGLKIGAKVKGDYKTVKYINYAVDIHYAQ